MLMTWTCAAVHVQASRQSAGRTQPNGDCKSARCRRSSAQKETRYPDVQTPFLRCAQGYGITLGAINALSVLTSVLQAIPSLPLQVRLPACGTTGCGGPELRSV